MHGVADSVLVFLVRPQSALLLTSLLAFISELMALTLSVLSGLAFLLPGLSRLLSAFFLPIVCHEVFLPGVRAVAHRTI